MPATVPPPPDPLAPAPFPPYDRGVDHPSADVPPRAPGARAPGSPTRFPATGPESPSESPPRGRHGAGVAAVAALAGAPWAAVAGLHRLGSRPWLRIGWDDPATWVRVTPLEDVLAAGLRSLALLAAWWLALSTTAYLLAVAARLPRLVATVHPFALPAVRRVVDRALAGALAVSTLAAPLVGATAEPDPGPPPSAAAAVPTGPTAPAFPPVPAVADPPPGPDATTFPAARDAPAPDSPAPIPFPPGTPASDPDPGGRHPGGEAAATASRVVVAPGDSLWLLAERRLAGVLGRTPTDPEVASYWVLVVASNRDGLRSGDPDLIYPGEVVVLPPVP